MHCNLLIDSPVLDIAFPQSKYYKLNYYEYLLQVFVSILSLGVKLLDNIVSECLRNFQ